MFNLRANRNVPDDSWWDNGGNDLWRQYATEQNVDRETNTMFLEDDQMASFLAAARTLPGWVERDTPLPFDCPLWYIRRSVVTYICVDWRQWYHQIRPPYQKMVRTLLKMGDSWREEIGQALPRAIGRAVAGEKLRWLVFGVTPKYIERMRGNQLVLSEWKGPYNRQFRYGMARICKRIDEDMLELISATFSADILLLHAGRNDRRDPEE